MKANELWIKIKEMQLMETKELPFMAGYLTLSDKQCEYIEKILE